MAVDATAVELTFVTLHLWLSRAVSVPSVAAKNSGAYNPRVVGIVHMPRLGIKILTWSV